MSYEETIQGILNKITLSDEDRQSYTKDADDIRDYIIRRMKETNKDLAYFFAGASLTGSYLDDLKIDVPDEFDIHIKLKLPDKIVVKKESRPISCLQLYYHPNSISALKRQRPNFDIFTNSYIDRVKLQAWIRNILEAIFDENFVRMQTKQTCRAYELKYLKSGRGYAVAHTFVAQSGSNREIYFDFVPAFEFQENDWPCFKRYNAPGSPWFAVPYSNPDDDLSFMVCAPHLERELLSNKKNLKNSLRLLKAIRDNNEMSLLTSYMMKTLYLWKNETSVDAFWERPPGYLLAYMAEQVVLSLEIGYIRFFWDNNINLLDRLDSEEKREYLQKLGVIVNKIKHCRDGFMPMTKLTDIFE